MQASSPKSPKPTLIKNCNNRIDINGTEMDNKCYGMNQDSEDPVRGSNLRRLIVRNKST